MYKSKLVCPQCSHVGVKFDPYMYLSLNLPESKRRTLQVTALYVDGAQAPMQHAVDVPKTGTSSSAIKVLTTQCRQHVKGAEHLLQGLSFML